MAVRNKEAWQNAEWSDPTTGEVHSTSGLLVQTSGALWIENHSMEGLMGRKKPIDVVKQADEEEEENRSKRGKIKTFSRASQKRLMLALSAWEPTTDLLFVTLTYPRIFPDSFTSQKHLKRFLHFFRQSQPSRYAGLWRLEYQVRGAPHYHFVMQGCTDEAERVILSQWVHKAWKRSRMSHDEARTEVAWANHQQGAKYYLAKEAGKSIQSKGAWANATESIDHYGRFWGWFNKDALRTNHIEYRFPTVVLNTVQKQLQNRVIEKMIDDGKIVMRGDKMILKSKNVEVETWRIQSWMLMQNTEAILREIFDALPWETLMPMLGWETRPCLTEFKLTFEPPPI